MHKLSLAFARYSLNYLTFYIWRVTMAKSKETFEKVAKFFTEKGQKEWAKAKNGDGGHHFANARKAFDTAEKATDSAKKAK